jgi:hypothetical protein
MVLRLMALSSHSNAYSANARYPTYLSWTIGARLKGSLLDLDGYLRRATRRHRIAGSCRQARSSAIRIAQAPTPSTSSPGTAMATPPRSGRSTPVRVCSRSPTASLIRPGDSLRLRPTTASPTSASDSSTSVAPASHGTTPSGLGSSTCALGITLRLSAVSFSPIRPRPRRTCTATLKILRSQESTQQAPSRSSV